MQKPHRAFTLIELSIVLVIIGLIVGGVLVGRDLIGAAAVRAQISQIEKYQTAVNTFKGKYNGYLPGDMPDPDATRFGFVIGSGCNGIAGRRDGNGVIEGHYVYTSRQGMGETGLLWQDLSSAKLIEDSFPNGGGAYIPCYTPLVLSLTPGSAFIGNNFPLGKMQSGTFIYVYPNQGLNWFGLSSVSGTDNNGNMFTSSTIPVERAEKIDRKIDDGIAATGSVLAAFVSSTMGYVQPSWAPSSSSDTAASCYNSTTGQYSTSYNNGAGPNCALSFKFQ